MSRTKKSAPTAALGALALLVSGAISVTTQATSTPAAAVAAAQVDRVLKDPRISAPTGLARSTWNRPLLLTHNSTGKPIVYAVNKSGGTRATVRLRGVKAKAWEDIATGPKHSVWVGDIGDEARKRKQVRVHRFTERKALPRKGKQTAVRPTTYRFRYPGGKAHHAEALLVNPRTGRLWVVTSGNSAAIYRAPKKLRTAKVMRLRKVAQAPASITAGSFSPNGRRMVLTSTDRAHTYTRATGKPKVSTLPKRARGESAEVSRNGRRLLLGTATPNTSVLTVTSPTDEPSVGSEWRLDLDQQFDSFDSTVWRRYDGESWDREDSRVLARNVTVENGALVLRAKKESVAGRNYTSGDVTTSGRYSLPAHFRVEVRAKVPFQQGMWAAPIWLRPVDGSAGEIDMVETYGQERKKPRLHHTVHTHYGTGHQQKVFSVDFSDLDGSATGWHTYTMEKTKGQIKMWVDGKLTAVYDRDSAPWFSDYYDNDKRWILRSSLQVGGADGLPDSSTNWSGNNTTMQLDYVKTWVKD